MMNYNTSNFHPLPSSSNMMSTSTDNNNNNDDNNNTNNNNAITSIDNNNNNNNNNGNNNNNHSSIKALNPPTSINNSTNINLQHPIQNQLIQQPNNNIHPYPYQPISLQHLQQQQIMPLPLQSQLYHQYPPPPYHFQLQQSNINSNITTNNDNIKINAAMNQNEILKDKQDNISKSSLKLRRGPWSPEEDKRLLQLVEMSGGERNLNWVKISQMLESRTAKQARERYHQNLKPSLNRTPITAEEGKLIEELVERYGKRWAEIARHLNGRSDNAIKNWWNGGANRRKRASTQGLTIKDYKDKDDIEMDHEMELESEKEIDQEKLQLKEQSQERDQEVENETQNAKDKEEEIELKIENGNKKVQIQQQPTKTLSLPAPPHSHQQQDQRRSSLSTVYPPLIASSNNNKNSFDVPLLPPLVDSNHHQFAYPHLHQLHSGRSASVDIRPSNSNPGPNISTPNSINFDISSIRKRKIFDDHLNNKPSRRHSAASINSASNFNISSVSNPNQTNNNNNTNTPGLYPGSPLSRLSSRNSSVGSSSDYATLHLTSGYTSDNNSLNSRRSSLFAPPTNAFTMTMVNSNLNEPPPTNVFKMKSPGIGPRLSITALNQYSISNNNNNNINGTIINSVQPHSNITNLNLDDNSNINSGGALRKDIFKKGFNLSNANTVTKLSMENEVEPTIKKNEDKKSNKEEDGDEKKNEDKQKMSISFLV